MDKLEWDSQFLQHSLSCLYNQLRIAVIHGGDSRKAGSVIYKTHNPRSTKTYEQVAQDIAEALRSIGFRHVFVMADDMQLPQQSPTSGKAGGLKKEPLKAACTYHSSVSRNCSMR